MSRFLPRRRTNNGSPDPGVPCGLWHDPDVRGTLPHHVRLVEMVLRDASQFDAIHFRCDFVHFPAARRQRLPTVTTMHGSIHAHDLAALLHEYGDVPLVSISNDQRRPVPDANWQATVYHGLPVRSLLTESAPKATSHSWAACTLEGCGSAIRLPAVWRAAQDRGEDLSRGTTVFRPYHRPSA